MQRSHASVNGLSRVFHSKAVKAGPVARCLYSRDFNAKLYNGGDEQRWHHARDDDDDDDGRVLPALNLCGLP